MSYFNKYKDVEIALPDIRGKIRGEYKMEAFKGYEFPRGSGIVWEYPFTRRVLAHWFENIVTDTGKEIYGNAHGGLDYCHVGTGNTPEQATDTTLGGFVAGVAVSTKSASAESTPPYFGSSTFKYRFSPNFGGGAVNLNEIGVSSTVTTGNLTSRALTVDGGGSPTTVSVLATEYLDCYYKRRNYPAHLDEATGAPTDDTGSIDVSGTPYGYTIRPCMVTQGGGTTLSSSSAWGSGMNYQFILAPGYGYSSSHYAHALDENAVLSAVTTAPGTGSNRTNGGLEAYTPNAYQRELWYEWGIGSANFYTGAGTGIGGLWVKNSLGMYQIIFDTPIPKVVGEVFRYYHNFLWDRKTTWV
jgi:hypothetical protein